EREIAGGGIAEDAGAVRVSMPRQGFVPAAPGDLTPAPLVEQGLLHTRPQLLARGVQRQVLPVPEQAQDISLPVDDLVGAAAEERRPGLTLPVGAVRLRVATEGQPEGTTQAGLAMTRRRERRPEKEGIVGWRDLEPCLELGRKIGEPVDTAGAERSRLPDCGP